MKMTQAEARKVYLLASINANSPKHSHTWSNFELLGAYLFSVSPSISINMWLKEMGIELEEEETEAPPAPEEDKTIEQINKEGLARLRLVPPHIQEAIKIEEGSNNV